MKLNKIYINEGFADKREREKWAKTTILEASVIWMFSKKGIEQKELHVDYLPFLLYWKTSKQDSFSAHPFYSHTLLARNWFTGLSKNRGCRMHRTNCAYCSNDGFIFINDYECAFVHQYLSLV